LVDFSVIPLSELDFNTTRTDAFSLSWLNSSPILSFVSNDFNLFIFISLSKSGELLLNGVIIAANKIIQTIILHDLCLAINEPNLYITFATILPPYSYFYSVFHIFYFSSLNKEEATLNFPFLFACSTVLFWFYVICCIFFKQ